MKRRTCLKCEDKKEVKDFFEDGIIHYWCLDCQKAADTVAITDDDSDEEPSPTPDYREIVF